MKKKKKANSLSFLNFNKYEKFKIDLLEQIKKDPVLNYHYDTFNNLSLEQLFTLKQFLKILSFDELSRLKGSMSIILKKPKIKSNQMEFNFNG
tara:strand:+ start:474 stop:752 length:279 start_codon:yes stop_codon:yes gene_type:complete